MALTKIPGSMVSTNAEGVIDFSSATGGFNVPRGTTAQRPTSPAAGQVRYNTTTNQTEIYSGNAWVGITSQNYSASYLVVAGGGAYTLGSGGYSGC